MLSVLERPTVVGTEKKYSQWDTTLIRKCKEMKKQAVLCDNCYFIFVSMNKI